MADAPGPQRPPPLPNPARPGTPLDAITPGINPYFELHNAHTAETVECRFHGPNGYNPTIIRQLQWIFRDWRAQVVVPICPRLYWGLAAVAAIARQGGGGVVTVYSGYRTPETNSRLPKAAPASLHMHGRAVDFAVSGLDTSEVASWMQTHEIGGVGFYPRQGFVHIDSGKVRAWSE